jgi:Tol biopolymer transport system component
VVVGTLTALGAVTTAFAQAPVATPDGATCGTQPPGPVGAAHANDGAPDPAGRIAFAVAGRYDEASGPIGTQLYAIDPDGSDQVLLLDCEVIRPAWSPDGTRLAFTIGFEDGSWHIATISANGSDLRVLTTGLGIHEIPTWSPDGTWLAYDSSPTHDFSDPVFTTSLWRVGADGSGAAPLWDGDTFDVEPRLSPDGTRVAFQRLHPDQDFASQFMVRDLASGEERALTPLGFPIEHPEWAPDGRSLTGNASDWAPTARTIYAIDAEADAAEPAVLLDPASGWGGVKPVYSPDGLSILFVCSGAATQDDEEGLCLMSADGTGVRELVDDPNAFENHTAWGTSAMASDQES